MGGGGVPTLDFVVFFPIPIVWGASEVLLARHSYPFTGFWLALYIALFACFALIHWLFDRHGGRVSWKSAVDPTTGEVIFRADEADNDPVR